MTKSNDYGEYKDIEATKNVSRHYVFTLNNYTWQNFEEMWDLIPNVRYIIFGAEIAPTTGTKHLQGYIELNTPQRFSKFFKNTALRKARFAKRWGTREQARNYCKKSDDDYFEWGNWSAGGQGARNDLKKCMQMIKEDKSDLEIMEEMPNIVSNNLRFYEKYKSLIERELTKEFRKIEVIVHYGVAGTGKTKRIFDEHPDAFTANCGESFPFDKYDGQKVLVLDDFYGHIKYHELLRILDGYQYRVNIKGACRYARWEKVFITSNKRPEEWYKVGMTAALKRRINKVITFKTIINKEHNMIEEDEFGVKIITKSAKDLEGSISEDEDEFGYKWHNDTTLDFE